MGLPESLRDTVQDALVARGNGSIVSSTPVGGGCINQGTRVETSGGVSLFVKWNASAPPGLFRAEVDGLRALRDAVASEGISGDVRIPEPIAWGTGGPHPAWLAMEYIEAGASGPATSERLGRVLATIHGAATGARFGWAEDNWIGSLEQANAVGDSWGDFWRDRRIVPQLRSARASGHLADAVFDRVVDAIPGALAGVTQPALLHGDLWGGNSYASREGVPVLIDPAVYRGDGEVDLAMTEFFGGFASGFYDAYHDIRPIGPAYRDHRRDLYQLYYLLVHVNLFGGSYVAGTRAAAERVAAALGA